MKKILYVVRIFSNKNGNLNSKFFSQMDGMKKNGFDVYYLSYENGIFNLMSFNDDICLFKKKYTIIVGRIAITIAEKVAPQSLRPISPTKAFSPIGRVFISSFVINVFA